jgi:hypothetical protein
MDQNACTGDGLITDAVVAHYQDVGIEAHPVGDCAKVASKAPSTAPPR